MSKYTNAIRDTIIAAFNAGDQPTEAQFTDWITRIQEGIDEHDHTEQVAGDGLKALGSTAGPLTLTIANAGCHILDTGGDHDLVITPGTDLSADRILTLVTGDAARTITLSGNPTLADWFDQSVKQASSPTFADIFTPTGGTFGIAGNELLTVLAAGTFGFSGILGITVESADWLGLAADKGRIVLTDAVTDTIQFLTCNVGIGGVPDTLFHIQADTSALFKCQRTTTLDNYAAFGIYNTSTGGAHNVSIGSKAETVLADSYLYFTADDINIHLAILRNGDIGMGTTAPTSALQVVGLPAYANNAAAVGGGLTAGAFYRTGGDPDSVSVVH